jgi:acyl-CoA thioesterase-1
MFPRCTIRRYGLRALAFNVVAALFLLSAATVAEAQPARAPKVLALGDSLTAGYGLPPEQAFPARLEARLRAEGTPVTILNAGVSGDTTAGGRARLGWALAEKPDFAIVALGANDALRGLDPAQAKANLDAILADLKGRNIAVLLLGMLAPPNFGKDYEAAFNAIYPALARKHDVALYPFFLDGVAMDRGLNQADGIHPNARGVDVLVERIAPAVKTLLGAKS